MTSHPTAAFDPRLAVGIGLVLASVAGVWALVAAADETVDVYVATSALVPGDIARPEDLTLRGVRLDAALSFYFDADSLPDDGVVVTRPIGAGELVPVSATGAIAGLEVTSIVVAVDGQLAASVDTGSTVDVWAASHTEDGEFAEPEPIVTDATVVRLVATESIVGAGETTAVEVLIPKERVAHMLETIANDDAVSVVPASLPN